MVSNILVASFPNFSWCSLSGVKDILGCTEVFGYCLDGVAMESSHCSCRAKDGMDQ